ncbi:hypothetical protein QBC37DRAFT_442751 [Rhypophila decipiens]|uniref:Uncharacterized protein n=1 Tax=Rhypophila decipiens TaxID=261697 RepID=A0AAN6Y0N5_9PEZI|nr:hypothetical protein QBC37DRAFT_442751 [Rhypophila decipiens]
MAPPHLHPRSRMTSTLFATTVVASFFVVGLPHVLPCPAPRVAFADGEMAEGGEGAPKRRRRKRPAAAPSSEPTVDSSGMIQFQPTTNAVSKESKQDGMDISSTGSKRECPVPKPKGVLGELLGFTTNKEAAGDKIETKSSETKTER